MSSRFSTPDLRVLPAPSAVRPRPPAPQAGRHLPLNRVRGGQEITLLSIQLPPGKRDALDAQGIRVSRRARVLHNDHKGRVILRVGNELFILGRLETARMETVVLG